MNRECGNCGAALPRHTKLFCSWRCFLAVRESRPTAIRNPDGRCCCGCGQMTPMASRNSIRRGYIRGLPMPYVLGHGKSPGQPRGSGNHRWRGGRTTRRGYVKVLMPGHPRGGKKGYVFEHILVAETAIGKHLPPGAEVHHVNGVKSDNRPANLVVCQDHQYHLLLHRRQRMLRGLPV